MLGKRSSGPTMATLCGFGVTCWSEVEDRPQAGIADRRRAEEILIAAREQIVGGGQWRDRQDLVALADRRGGVGDARGIGTEEEAHLVLGDELLGELGAGLRLARVVIGHELDLVGLAADLDAARGIRRIRPHLVAVAQEFALAHEGAALAHCHADLENVLRLGAERAQDQQPSARDERGQPRETTSLHAEPLPRRAPFPSRSGTKPRGPSELTCRS